MDALLLSVWLIELPTVPLDWAGVTSPENSWLANSLMETLMCVSMHL